MTIQRWANLAWQLGGDAALVREVCDGADLVTFVEARDRHNRPVPVQEILDDWRPGHWRVWQDTSDGARSGSVIAVRIGGPFLPRWWRLLQVSRPGRKVQERYLRTLGWRDLAGPGSTGALHLALRSSGRQEEGVQEARGWVKRRKAARRLNRRSRWVLFADGNMPAEVLAALIGAPHWYGQEVAGVFWSDGWKQVRVHAYRLRNTDHVVLQFNAMPA